MMAEAVVGVTVQVVLEKLLSFVADQIGMLKEFKKDLVCLKKRLELISAFLHDAEKKQVESVAVNVWLKNLEGVTYRAEHILDEINYEMLRRRVKGRVSCFSSLAFRLKMTAKLKDINNQFESINKDATDLGLQIANYAIVPPSDTRSSREKTSILGQKVIGRGKHEETIVQKLLSQSNEVLNLIPIIGIGGLGKTTLAQSVFNNKQVVDHFGQRIWVCVLEGYSPMNIFKLILESLLQKNVDNMQLDVIVKKIQENLKDKSYLLVLDDVWSGHPESAWGEFLCTLRGISKSIGNYIIVTTREISMASIFCPRRDHFSLEKLSGEDCLEIVKEKALIYEDEESVQYFEAIRENIKKMCQGIPLVARVIGGLLCRNPPNDWHSVLEKGISNMIGDEKDDIQKILKLSFDHLHSPSLKKCFTYCSLLDKDSTMQKKHLIQLWMAEGFLQPKPDHDDMEIGNECINNLLGSSLLQEAIRVEGDDGCVQMHDLVHDLAQSMANPTRDLKVVKEEDRYLLIRSVGKDAIPHQKTRMLRTLFLEKGICDNMLIMSFKHLYVLKLSHVESHKLPSSICKLIHLRYLGISHSEIRVIPESISKLFNLQTLRIEECFGLGALPKGMTKLFNLRHLHFDNRYVSLPPKIGNLASLQTLEHFVPSEGNQIKELGCLRNLRSKLNIYNLDSVSSRADAQQAGLNGKLIKNLSFYWRDQRKDHVYDEEVLEGLQPHPHLQKLKIESFLGNQFPSWFMNMVLDRLVSLSIKNCRICKQLPALGQLPSLKYLELRGLDNISCIEPSFYGIDVCSGSKNYKGSGQVPRKIFPALRQLVVHGMKNLKEWMEYQKSNSEVVDLFPNLEALNMKECRKLSHAPIHYFRSLKKLKISSTNLKSISFTVEKDQICSRSPNSAPLHDVSHIPTHLELLRIYDCPNLSELREDLYELHSLRELEIIDCSNLKTLPIPMGQRRLTSLQRLEISHCNELTSLPDELLNSCTSLTFLKTSYCNGLTSLPTALLSSCASLTSLGIYCGGLTSLPTDLLGSCASLTHLWIDCDRLTSLPADLLGSCASLTFLAILCGGLTSLPADLRRSCASLTHLWIDCDELTSLPADLLGSYASLTSLKIHCGGLTSLPAWAHVPF